MSYFKYLFVFSVFLLFSCSKNKEIDNEEILIDSTEIVKTEYGFGFELNNYRVERDTIKRGDNLGLILGRHNFDATDIHIIAEKVKDSFNIAKIKAGNVLTLLKSKSDPPKLEVLIYEPDKMGFNVIDFRDSTKAYTVNYPVTYKTRTIAGEIDGSLSSSIAREGLDAGLAHKLAKSFAWSIDFFKFKKGDKFALSVTEKYINDSIYIGTEEILGAYFEYKGKDVYGFPYAKSGHSDPDFYDEEGKQMRTMFLKAPLKYFQITSKFSKNRFHPVQKKFKAHNGTDYAAPQGTPIMATASGTVIQTGYTSGNGNFVKIKHDGIYSTQYLHMSKILVRKGQFVQQGQTIGKVGSTGLATGPHVCYRFWKNGVQVDPLKQQLPVSEPMDKNDLPKYLEYIKPIKQDLDIKLNQKFKK
ncbi:M23 family metallopeptidase [Flavobacterium sp. I3-2]|uniref:M23 family metallopeptidase n=1 Tax=Flavobacterium sp. I3-2 TaxID=2748319 RepID=UPI0015ADA301|nr:peptidoglycan DD-metalloendopeptidase family protein [Flavobacterium sp. I3-2]